MLNTEQFKQIKNRALPQNSEKSIPRFIEGWKSLSAQQKKDFLALTGLGSSTVTKFTVEKAGAVSTKIILGLAQFLNVSPYYCIGTMDEKGMFSDEELEKFLKEFDIGLSSKTKSEKRKYTKKSDKDGSDKKEKKAKTVSVKEEKAAETVKVTEKMPLKKEEAAVVEDKNLGAGPMAVLEMSAEFDGSEQMKNAVKNLELDDALILLEALFKKAEMLNDYADLYEFVKYCLLA